MAFSAGFRNIGEEDADFYADFTGGDSSFSGYRYVDLVLNGNRAYNIRSNERGGGSSSFDETITNLSPGTQYSWEAQLGYDDGSGTTWLDIYDSGSFTTDETAILVEPWSWTRSNGSATNAQTQRAYDVIMGNITADNFAHEVWNDLVDKVAEMREAKGYTWDRAGGTYPSASGCKMSAGDRLTAAAYNGVRYNIGSVFSTGISDQSPGDQITGYKIYHLTEVLNIIIDNL